MHEGQHERADERSAPGPVLATLCFEHGFALNVEDRSSTSLALAAFDVRAIEQFDYYDYYDYLIIFQS